MGVEKSPLQKTYEISVESNSINVEFLGSNRQFDWIEISLVYDKSDKHLTIYDSYNVEKEYDVSSLMQSHMLYKQIVAWSCDGCSVATLMDYINNTIYQELPEEKDYFTTSDERIYLDLRASYRYTNEMEKLEQNDSKLNLKIQLKTSATKKLRLRIWGYSMGEYLYILGKDGLTLQHKTYSITSEDNDFE